MSLPLHARPRTVSGRHLGTLRRQGVVPLVLYGYQQETLAIEADAKELERTWQRAGRTTLVDLSVEGHTPRKVLFREVQTHPRTGHALHADLYAPNLRQRTVAEVPVVLTGESPAVQQKLGQVLQVSTHVKVEGLPTDLPGQLHGDVSTLVEADSLLTAGELALPSGLTLVSDPGEVVAKISGRRGRDTDEEEGEGGEAEEGADASASGDAEESAEG